jgi:hypothetical protein
MGGAAMQLVAYGTQDLALTGNPQITFFKLSYRRHTNFSIESIEQQFNGTLGFGRTLSCQIARNGDLLHNMELRIVLPAVPASNNESFRWLNWVGHILVKYVELEIGGQKIDKHYGHWLHIWNELTQTAGHQAGYANLVGNVPRLVQSTTGDTPSVILYIPLQFWFNRNPGLALPLIALQFHDVKINLLLAEKAECYWASGNSRIPAELDNISLWVDYIYLDTDERRRFAQANHEYLIEQLQYNGTEIITQTTNLMKMAFNHPVKEIIWTTQKNDVIDTLTMRNYGGNQWFNYTDAIDYTYFAGTPADPLGGGISGAAGGGTAALPMTGVAALNIATAGQYGTSNAAVNISGLHYNDLYGEAGVIPAGDAQAWTAHLPVFDSGENPTAHASLLLNGYQRFAAREGRYFNLVQPYKYHTNIPATGINVYSFALKPEDHQPSGSCNFSKLAAAQLNVTFTNNTTNNNTGLAYLRIYAVNYNMLRIMSGFGGLAYTH